MVHAHMEMALMPPVMRVWPDLSALPPEAKNLVVAIGNFDGVHLGHQAVISAAQRQARELNTGLAVLMFAPNPRQFFAPDAPPSELTPLHTRARYLSLLGVQQLYIQKFDLTFSKLEDMAFIEKVLAQQLGARHVVVGENFHFGHKRHGDVNFLIDQSARLGFGVTPVPPVRMTNGQVYSSTRVRECLQQGDVAGARQILGRPFEIEGTVERGQGLARDWGFPTANMTLGNYIRPKYGVYAVRAALVGPAAVPEWFGGVANLGVRPTFRGGNEVFETHLFDFKDDLYDRRLRVQLWHYLRPEEKFGKAEALRAQITKDAADARARLGG